VPCCRGREIDKYILKPLSEMLFYPYEIRNGKTRVIDEISFKKHCPCYYKYLAKNKDLIFKREYFTKSSKQWYELWNQRDLTNFDQVKIITPELSERCRFAIADPGMFYGDTVCGLVIKRDYANKIDLKYLLALLNSSLIEWYYKHATVPKAGGFFIFKVMFLSKIPVKIGNRSAPIKS
jgi:hypothetical protein